MADDEKKKDSAEEEVKDSSTTEESSEDTSTSSPTVVSSEAGGGNTAMIATIAGVVVLVVALLFGLIFFMRDSDEGIDIPDDFETYEDAEDFEFGYPEDWEVTEFGGQYIIAEGSLDAFAEEPENFMSIFAGFEEVLAEEEDSLDLLKDQDCDAFIESSNNDDTEEADLVSADDLDDSKAVSLNGVKGCLFAGEDEDDEDMYVWSYFLVDEDDKVYVLAVTSQDKDSDDYDELVKATKTFSLK